jgi:hypothetical protein
VPADVPTGWTVDAASTAGTQDAWGLRAYAICATTSN